MFWYSITEHCLVKLSKHLWFQGNQSLHLSWPVPCTLSVFAVVNSLFIQVCPRELQNKPLNGHLGSVAVGNVHNTSRHLATCKVWAHPLNPVELSC